MDSPPAVANAWGGTYMLATTVLNESKLSESPEPDQKRQKIDKLNKPSTDIDSAEVVIAGGRLMYVPREPHSLTRSVEPVIFSAPSLTSMC